MYRCSRILTVPCIWNYHQVLEGIVQPDKSGHGQDVAKPLGPLFLLYLPLLGTKTRAHALKYMRSLERTQVLGG